MKRKIPVWALLAVAAILVIYSFTSRRNKTLIVTGLITTDHVIVSSEVQGRLQHLLVGPGDAVKKGDLLAQIQPREWKADMTFYSRREQELAAQVTQAEADLKFQETQTSNQIRQAEANLAAVEAQVRQADADLENARLTFERLHGLYGQNVESAQAHDQARNAFESAKAHADSLRKQVQAAEAAVSMARGSAEQVTARRAAVEVSRQQLAAGGAQKEKAEVRLNYTEIQAPITGVVDVRAALEGEVVNPTQPIVTLINPDNLWVRADVEESYIDRIRLGQKLSFRLPSGAQREGIVFYRGVDADFATQRDVSRTKRDIRTFEIRLRCDNTDRRLAVGMTTFVTLLLDR
jgi:multidrug resistance efflux pump